MKFSLLIFGLFFHLGTSFICYFVFYLKMDFRPDKYWYTAVPTHILVSLIVIFCTVKGFKLIKTIDNPLYSRGLKPLTEKEMKKEIEYKKEILPDSGDLPEEVVKEVISLNN